MYMIIIFTTTIQIQRDETQRKYQYNTKTQERKHLKTEDITNRNKIKLTAQYNM